MKTNTEAFEFSDRPMIWFWKLTAIISIASLAYKLWGLDQFDISHLAGFALPIGLLALSASNIFVPDRGRLYQAGQILAFSFFVVFIISVVIEMIQWVIR